jgi:hypothetical protein
MKKLLQKMEWKKVTWTGWREDSDEPGSWHGQFVGETTDGQFFYENAHQESLDHIKLTARHLLDRHLYEFVS